MLRSERRPIERDLTTALEHAIDVGLGEVFVVEDATPLRQRLAGREDHGAGAPMAIIDHVEEHVGGVGPIGEIADIVDDQKSGCVYAVRASARRPAREAAKRSSMSSAAVTKRASKPF